MYKRQISRWTGIPISKISESETEKLTKLEDIIHERLINQTHAVEPVAQAIRRGRAGLKSSERPIGSFVFLGPTGVGKTELSKTLAEVLFGQEEAMIRFDMTEYMEKHEVAKPVSYTHLDVYKRQDKVWTDKDSTRIIGGKGSAKIIASRVAQIKTEIDAATSDFDKDKLHERLAKLTGGVAVISVGAITEVELKEKKERVDDAVSATKAALEEGIVAGGGTTFLKVRKSLIAMKEASKDEEEKVGIDIVYQALAEPVRMLAYNSGIDSGLVLSRIEESKDVDYGFNARTLEYGSMIKQGIVDPTKVVRSALENAASIAVMILTCLLYTSRCV